MSGDVKDLKDLLEAIRNKDKTNQALELLKREDIQKLVAANVITMIGDSEHQENVLFAAAALGRELIIRKLLQIPSVLEAIRTHPSLPINAFHEAISEPVSNERTGVALSLLDSPDIQNLITNSEELQFAANHNYDVVVQRLLDFKEVLEHLADNNHKFLRDQIQAGSADMVQRIRFVYQKNAIPLPDNLNHQINEVIAKERQKYTDANIMQELNSAIEKGNTKRALELLTSTRNQAMVVEDFKFTTEKLMRLDQNVLFMAARSHQPLVVKKLLEILGIRKNVNALLILVKCNEKEEVMTLLKEPDILRQLDVALDSAIKTGDLKLVQEFLTLKDVRDDAHSFDNRAIHTAAGLEHFDMVLELLEIKGVQEQLAGMAKFYGNHYMLTVAKQAQLENPYNMKIRNTVDKIFQIYKGESIPIPEITDLHPYLSQSTESAAKMPATKETRPLTFVAPGSPHPIPAENAPPPSSEEAMGLKPKQQDKPQNPKGK